MKCQSCKGDQAVWAWQPFGPDDSPFTFTALGSHYRGFPVIKICDSCYRLVAKDGAALRFAYKGREYECYEGDVRPIQPFELWDGGTTDFRTTVNGREVREGVMLCRDNPTGHDIVGVVAGPDLAAAIIDAYNRSLKP